MELSLEEKIKLVSGKGMWNTNDLNGRIDSITFSDGPHGIRKEVNGESYASSQPSTCFPTASCLACSWDIDLMTQIGHAIAKEAIEKEIDIILGPGINIKRTPICGRNFEYFSEDPYLSGILAASYINAIESKGVGTSLKHFAVNNQEANRQTANSQVDERALREIYLRGFELALSRSKPATLMCSYNRINGNYATENYRLLTEILRNEWDYKGCVISDWGACIDLAKSLEAGMDLEMPDSLGLHGKDLKKRIKSKQFDLRFLDRASNNIINLVEKYSVKKDISNLEELNTYEIARKAASESAVLLKNDGILPFKMSENRSLFVIGAMAQEVRIQGGGSSRINPKSSHNALDSLRKAGFLINYEPGYILESEDMDDDLIKRAIEMSRKADEILFFGGLTDNIEGEGFDRKDLNMPANQLHLLKEIAKLNKKIVYISFLGAPYRVDFLNDVSAFVQMYLAGEASSDALVDIISGRVNPSGKLAETWPIDLNDVLSNDYYDKSSKDLEYRESIFVGYRYFDSYDIKTRFDFGYGLSYSKFEYSDIKVDINLEKKKYIISFNLANISEIAGKEIVQVYIKNPKEYFLRASRELRGFTKVSLNAGEGKKVEIDLDPNSFSIYDPREKRYLDNSGIYEIQVCASLSDIKLRKEVIVNAEKYTKVERAALAHFFVKGKPTINKSSFEHLYDKRLSRFDKTRIGQYSLYNSLDDMAKVSWIAKLIRHIVLKSIKSMYNDVQKAQVKMMLEGAKSGPFDTVISQSKSIFLRNVGLFMVDLCNKRRIKAIKSLIFGR